MAGKKFEVLGFIWSIMGFVLCTAFQLLFYAVISLYRFFAFWASLLSFTSLLLAMQIFLLDIVLRFWSSITGFSLLFGGILYDFDEFFDEFFFFLA